MSAAALGVLATTQTAVAAPPVPPTTDLGQNVLVFSPDMPQADIQAKVDAVYEQQVDNEMGTARYALLFKPGTYGSATNPLDIRVGYYTEVDGLGQDPSGVTINGGVTATGRNGSGSLDTFWRSVSNLTIHVVPTADACHTGNEMWAVSQAAPMRRVDVKDYTSFMPYCEDPNYASGGFVADSKLEGGALNGSQQQFYVRNTDLGAGWSNGVWNQVFSGDLNAPAQSFPVPPYTTLTATPVSREKPYLYVDDHGAYRVFVPSAATNSVGPSWADGHTPGRSLPLSDFFVAHPTDSVTTINAALAKGKNLLVTPGVYDVAKSIAVKRADIVVLGLGLATLTAQNGAVPMVVGDVPGVDIAGLTFDAGTVNSPTLLKIGSGHHKVDRNPATAGSAADPTALQDVFFRIGGPHVGKATTSLEVNSSHTILDDIWAWRADHGVAGSVGWTVNTADTGVVVNGDDVTATGLFVEHYQKYNVIWNGERGRTVFFQNELPYDAPDQASWRHQKVNGWAAYKVSDKVKTHEAWGLGSYIFTNVNPTLHATQSFEVPDRPGVVMHDMTTVALNTNAGTIDHVVNGQGSAATGAVSGQPQTVTRYSNKVVQ
ncbi:adenylyl cyclase [Curtobacterium sp. MCPF17_047]|uniref:adenylyl cyclase n=1 Tax=Curtobacterium sp. MCPF17_052 TaxID=2175655 RepID=UPI000DA810D3|nr:adenylyl cyclase [Curtobacterium sp. MCPF17_052]PZE62907.1 adenylyl cyclase [Curtobacterium sp. MCPF17_001]PZF68836.1 adenylyl cyclase [Curtobacterium sp. MCPF17_047]WIB11433.1 adenylyl cyclase [Curtobacterium sp. MCPF17_052]